MTRYIVHRLLQGIVLLCMVATIVFFLGRLTGNPIERFLTPAPPINALAGLQYEY